MANSDRCYIFTCTPELETLVESVAKHIEGGVEALFSKGVILMSVAIKAKSQGHKLAIVDKDNNIIDTIDM